MAFLALLVWLALEHSIVAPWWIWVLWGVGYMATILHTVLKPASK